MDRFDRWLPFWLFLIALLVRLVAAWLTRFDGLYGQDPYAYFNYAVELRHALAAGQAPPPFFWPLGYPLLVAAVMTLVGEQPLAGQWVSMVTGALIAPLVYLLAQEARPGNETNFGHLGGLFAGLMTAVAGQLLLSSLSVMADAAALFWATLSAWAMLRYGRRDLRLPWLALAAATLAFAVLTRWVYGLLVIPWGLSAWLAWRETTKPGSPLPWRPMLTAGSVAVVIGLFILGAHFAADLGRGGVSYAGDLEVYTWNPANAFKRVVHNPDGTFVYERPIGLFYALPAFHPSYLFPLFSPFLLLGLVSLWPARPKGTVNNEPGFDKSSFVPLSHIALLVGWPLTVYLFLAGVTWQNWRFPLSFFPPLLVLAGLGLAWTWAKLQARWRAKLVSPFLLAGLALALAGSLAWAARDIGRFTAWKNSQLATAEAVAGQLPPDATLLVFEITLTMDHYTAVPVIELFAQDEADLAALVNMAESLYLLLNVDNVTTQWVGKSPYLNYHWLRENRGLVEIGRYEPYTLFQVTGRN